MVVVVGTWGGRERARPSRYLARRIHNRKGTDPQVQMVDLRVCWGSGWLQGCHRCAFRNGNEVGNRKGTRLVFTGGGTFGRRIKTFTKRKNKHKKTQKITTLEDGRPWWRTKVGKRKAVSAEGRAPGCR